MEFKELKKDEISKVESEITEFWNKEDILKQSIDNRTDNFVFFIHSFFRIRYCLHELPKVILLQIP